MRKQPDARVTTPLVDDLVVLGRISGVFGVKGWLKVWSYTDPVEGILDYPVWQIRMPQGWESCEWESGQRQGKGIIVRLPGCDDREVARRFVQADVAVPRSALPPLSADEYYWYQLEGLQVYAVCPQAEPVWLGTVDHLLETGANDVLVVEPAEGSLDKRQRLIPWVPDKVVLGVDLARGEMQVDWDPDF